MEEKEIHFNLIKEDTNSYKGLDGDFPEYSIIFSYKENALNNLLTYPYSEKDSEKLDGLSEFEIYESMESIYEAPTNKTKEELIEYLKSKGFIYNPKFNIKS